MTDTLFRKNAILRDFNIHKVSLSKGLDVKNRLQPNNENYVTLIGTKPQINSYLQDASVLSDRLRTLNDLPRTRVIDTKVVRIQ
jgi:hypothetical protein